MVVIKTPLTIAVSIVMSVQEFHPDHKHSENEQTFKIAEPQNMFVTSGTPIYPVSFLSTKL